MKTNNPKYILIHCSDISYKKVPNQFHSININHRDVRNFNMSSLGWNVGYHRLITGGRNYRCRVDEEYGNHCNTIIDGLSMNFQSLGICWAGDGDIELPTLVDYNLIQKQVLEWQDIHKIPDKNVYFHRYFSS